MKTIYKYPLVIDDSQIVTLPVGSKVLTVQLQNEEQPMLWAMIDTNETVMVDHVIEMYGTGHSINELKRKYISTIQLRYGRIVFHIFEKSIIS